MMVNIKFHGYTKKKVEFIYKMLGILLNSVPYAIEEDVRDVLFNLALDVIHKPEEYIYTVLRNEKLKILKSSAIKNNVLNNSLCLLDHGDENDHCHRTLFLMEDFNILFIAYATKFNNTERKFFREVLRHFERRHKITWSDISYFMKFSRERGNKVKSTLQGKIENVKNSKGTKLLRKLRTIKELQTALREFDRN